MTQTNGHLEHDARDHVAYHQHPSSPNLLLAGAGTSTTAPYAPPRNPQFATSSAPAALSLQRAAAVTTTTGSQTWNTDHLAWRVASDLTAAGCAASLVAPVITMIDRGIIERASTCKPLRVSLRESLIHLATRPHLFLTSRPFLLIAGLYFGTYATANTTDTLTNTFKDQPASRTNSGPTKFAATSVANMSLCLYKDSQFTRMFSGGGNPAASVTATVIPKASYALFALRDSLTIFASFNLPPVVAPILPGFTGEVERYVSRASAAQFLVPAAMQLLSTPLHLLGLDLYNRPSSASTGTVGWRERFRVVRRDWGGCSFARMGRIIPAFGVGGVVNTEVRKKMLASI